MGGRLVLLNSALQNLPVYWLSLEKVPGKIISSFRHICTNFLWKGLKKPSGYHLASWDLISKPHSYGGWGIRNINTFARALATKSLWRALFGTSRWSKVILKKYLKGMDLVFWLHLQ
jgi:hypothetical protein